MTYALERQAIATYFAANWTGTIGQDAHQFTPEYGAIRLAINSGAVMQGSIGRTANRMDHIGTLTITIYTEGGNGSDAWRQIADDLIAMLENIRLADDGTEATAPGDTFIRFSPPEMGENAHPYIGASFADAPFHITNLIAPFVRYDFR